MFRLSRIFTVLAVFLLSVLFTNTESHAWTVFAAESEIFAVGTADGSEWSYLYKINPLTGELILLGDTGHNNCTGLDFNPEGKLKATCEVREGNGVEFNTNAVAGTPVVLELDSDDSFPEWAVPHGISNFISDITIADDGVLYSYENLKQDNLHMHLEENDFLAQFIGNPGIKALDLGMAVWGGDEKLKIAANTGTPSLYSVDSKTADVELIGALNFPADFQVATMQEIATRVKLDAIDIISMDSTRGRIAGVDIPNTNSTSAVAGSYAFAENDADFAVLLTTSDERVLTAADTRIAGSEVWAGIALLDVETLSVDYIVDVDLTPVEVDAIAVRRIPPRTVPTLSTTGIVVAGTALLLIGLIFYRRKFGLSS